VWKSRIENVKRNECIRSRLAKELLDGYPDDMTPENLALTRLVANYKDSFGAWMRLLFTNRLKCAPVSIRLTSKIAILTRRF
jgi:hypothetical protein